MADTMTDGERWAALVEDWRAREDAAREITSERRKGI
jgi:hypothetical protein